MSLEDYVKTISEWSDIEAIIFLDCRQCVYYSLFIQVKTYRYPIVDDNLLSNYINLNVIWDDH